MKKHTLPISCETFYHVYNRGINGESLFKEPNNYAFFLKRYAKYIAPVADTYAYCLMNNHLHLLVRTKSAREILPDAVSEDILETEKIAARRISHGFSVLFNSYAQAINKMYGRTGGLFEETFRRIQIDSELYLRSLIFYIHHNPQKHGFVGDFRLWRHSSYPAFLSELPTKIKREDVFEWFGTRKAFFEYHESPDLPLDLERFVFEG